MELPQALMSWTISLWRKPSTEASLTLEMVSPGRAQRTSVSPALSDVLLCSWWPTTIRCAALRLMFSTRLTRPSPNESWAEPSVSPPHATQMFRYECALVAFDRSVHSLIKSIHFYLFERIINSACVLKHFVSIIERCDMNKTELNWYGHFIAWVTTQSIARSEPLITLYHSEWVFVFIQWWTIHIKMPQPLLYIIKTERNTQLSNVIFETLRLSHWGYF